MQNKTHKISGAALKRCMLSMLCAASFYACAELDPQRDVTWDIPCGGVPVTFGAFGKWDDETGTRAVTSGNSTAFVSSDRIGVFAYNDNSRTPDFMNNQTVTFDGSTWTYSPIKYWPASEGSRLSFYAYFPQEEYGNSVSINAQNSERPVLIYTCRDSKTDLLTAISENLTYSKRPVCLQFEHQLVQIRFRFRNAWEEKKDMYHLGINYLYFKCNMNTVLTYDYGIDEAVYSDAAEKAYMPEVTNPKEYFEYSDKYTDIISPYYFVPESIESGKLELGIDVFEKKGEIWKKTTVHNTPTYIAKASLPDKSGLKKGSTVVYDISYKPDEGLVITMITEVDGWTEVDNNNEI